MSRSSSGKREASIDSGATPVLVDQEIIILMLLEPLRDKDDLREKNRLVEYDPTDFWLLIKRIILCYGFSFRTLVQWMISQLINEVQR